MDHDRRRRRSFGGAIGYLLGLALIVGAGYGVYRIWQQQDVALAASRVALDAEVARGPKVEVAVVNAGPKERLIKLLGDTRAYQTVTLYSKVGGYLKSIPVDRGDRVKAGQVIAEVASEETDQQYASALTDLENKRKNLTRAQDLVRHGSLSVQAADQADTDFRMALANVAQLQTMKSYEVLRAPFDGRITARYVDVGSLVQNSTTNQTSNQPVVTMMDESRLRVDVYVGQRDVPDIHVGDLADVSDAANEERTVRARIARTSDELDPRTRTLFVELDVDNASRFLLPGAFAYVTLHVPLRSYPEVPAAGLVVRGTQTFVADVDSDGLVHFRPVTVASTDGTSVRLAAGAMVGQRVALNLPDDVPDGGRIQPVTAGQ